MNERMNDVKTKLTLIISVKLPQLPTVGKVATLATTQRDYMYNKIHETPTVNLLNHYNLN